MDSKRTNYDRFYRVIAKSTMIVLSIIGGFLLCEFASRQLWPPGRMKNASTYDLEKVPAPYVMFKGNQTDLKEVGPHGYKGEPPTAKKPKGEIRVFMLGGSTLFHGGHIPNEVTRLAHQAGLKAVKVFNYSIPSSKSGEELARLIYEVSDLEPDFVVFYDGANDLADPCGDPRPGYPFNFMTVEANPLLIRSDYSYPTLTLTLFGSNLLRHFLHEFFVERLIGYMRLRDLADHGSPEWTEKATAIYWKNIERADAFSRAIGADFFHFFQPTKHFYDYDRAGRPVIEKERWAEYASPNSLLGREIYREKMRAHPRIRSTDLSDVLNGKPEMETFISWSEDGERVWDPIHVQAETSRAIAEQIFAVLKTELSAATEKAPGSRLSR